MTENLSNQPERLIPIAGLKVKCSVMKVTYKVAVRNDLEINANKGGHSLKFRHSEALMGLSKNDQILHGEENGKSPVKRLLFLRRRRSAIEVWAVGSLVGSDLGLREWFDDFSVFGLRDYSHCICLFRLHSDTVIDEVTRKYNDIGLIPPGILRMV